MKRKAIIVLCFTNMLTLGILADTKHNNAYTVSEQNKQINQLAQFKILQNGNEIGGNKRHISHSLMDNAKNMNPKK